MVEWWNGMVEWWNGMVEWWNGMVEWWNGMVEWWNGMVEWCGIVEWNAFHHSCNYSIPTITQRINDRLGGGAWVYHAVNCADQHAQKQQEEPLRAV